MPGWPLRVAANELIPSVWYRAAFVTCQWMATATVRALAERTESKIGLDSNIVECSNGNEQSESDTGCQTKTQINRRCCGGFSESSRTNRTEWPRWTGENWLMKVNWGLAVQHTRVWLMSNCCDVELSAGDVGIRLVWCGTAVVAGLKLAGKT